MLKQSLILFLFIGSTLLFGAANSMTKAIISNGGLQLFFATPLNKNDIKHISLSNFNKEIFDFKNINLAHSHIPLGLGDGITISQETRNLVRVVIESSSSSRINASQLDKNKYFISLPNGYQAGKNSSKHNNQTKTKYQRNNKYVASVSRKDSQFVRHNESIVIDAGHGGHDSGAIAGGKKEKDLVLAIALKVAEQLKKRGFIVYLTRKGDYFLKLNERTEIADKKDSKIFVSIHANSVPKNKCNVAQGVETFFLQNTRDARSQAIAAEENRAVLKGTDRVSKHVILDSVLSGPKIVESNKLAIAIQRRIMTDVRGNYRDVRDGGVRHAPFYVLVGASRPSVLVEVGYISHSKERQRLFTANYQHNLANGIAEGIENYLNNRRKEIDF